MGLTIWQLQLTGSRRENVQAAQIRCQPRTRLGESKREMRPQGPVDFKPLPVARGNPRQPSLVLFYAYREPAWSAAEHSRALKTFIKLCEAHDLKGRGRCAPRRQLHADGRPAADPRLLHGVARVGLAALRPRRL